MTDDLYFLPILVHALREPCGRQALHRAFEQIETMGAEPRYRRGHQQYRVFMSAVREASQVLSGDATSNEVPLDLAGSAAIEVIVERDGVPIASFATDGRPGARTLEGITPGLHRLRLDSGRVFWEGELTEAHLLWPAAFPGRPLRMAADTGQAGRATTHEVSLLSDTLRLRVRPGVGSGYLELELTTRSESQP